MIIHIPRDLFTARESGDDYFSKIYPTEEKNEYFNYLFAHSNYNYLPDEVKELILGSSQYGFSVAFTKQAAIVVPTNSGRLLTESEKVILKRFARVFEQTYTRFLDLQKAEAQAREAQIEAALERVRSSAMAMRMSEELNTIIAKVFSECVRLDMQLDRGVIMIFDPETLDARWWMANPEVPDMARNYLVKHHLHRPYQAQLNAWKESAVKWSFVLEGEEKEDWDKFLFYDTELATLPAEVKRAMMGFKKICFNASFNSFGCLLLSSEEPMTDETFDIVLRFAKVFDLTYTRFNDLKQAEAQARESQIQLALERVRARTMAMHKSEELAETARLLYDEFRTLAINTFTCGYIFIKEDQHKQTCWVTLPDGTLIADFINFPLTGDHVLDKRYEDWKQRKPIHVFEIQCEGNKEHHRFLASKVPDETANEIFAHNSR